MALQQTASEYTLRYHQSDAEEKYPAEDSSRALERYAKEHGIEGIFFLNDAGERCAWGPVIKYSHYTGYRGTRWDFCHDDSGRIFLTRKGQRSLSRIDRPKPLETRELIAHPSEIGWNHPYGHKYHISSFSPEIKNLIFSMALAVVAPAAVLPQVITCNWKRLWASTTHTVDWGQASDDGLAIHRLKASFQRSDCIGSFIELRLIERRAIDASLLRACSEFYKIGSGILYSNTFYFQMRSRGYENNPPSMVTKKQFIWRPNPGKPRMNDRRRNQKVQQVILDIRAQVNQFRLSGWAYYDPFLRFLYAIGPANAALLKKVELRGVVRLHRCVRGNCERPCADDLVHCLHLYIPIIQAVCTGLEELILYAEEDTNLDPQFVLQHQMDQDSDEDEDGASDIGKHVATPTEAVLRPLLEKELRQIQSLRKLEVFRSKESHDLYEWAIPAMHWFDVRNKQRKVAMEAAPNAPQACNSNTKIVNALCGFCREAHPWNKCYNLCSLRGKYGHLKKTCSRASRKKSRNRKRV